jgi:hypothetical protein
VPLLRSLETSRLNHVPLEVERATLRREAGPARVTVPAGTFEVERRTVEIAGGPTWRVAVEAAEPHRIVEWERATVRRRLSSRASVSSTGS